MVIGLYGLDFGSNNLGCVALSYGFIEILKKANVDEKIEIISFDECDEKVANELIASDNISLSVAQKRSIKSINGLSQLIAHYKRCDMIFDFTAGDSFSDIYGKKRFYTRSIRKELVIFSKTPLILGSQTYGPFNSKLVRLMAGHIIKKSYKVFSRDNKSSKVIREIAGREPVETLDVAFELPYSEQKLNGKSLKIGFNPSGLLWSGGYVGNNQFGLKFNYREFCVKLIKKLLDIDDATIYLVSHVRSNDLNSSDNDMIACSELKKIFPELVESPFFNTPMEAKSYISGLDYFIGSRMHATIAAFTSGVITIPVAYSRKFEGLFDDLEYPFIINATTENQKTAVRKIFEVLDNKEDSKLIFNKSFSKSVQMKQFLEKEYENVINTIRNGD